MPFGHLLRFCQVAKMDHSPFRRHQIISTSYDWCKVFDNCWRLPSLLHNSRNVSGLLFTFHCQITETSWGNVYIFTKIKLIINNSALLIGRLTGFPHLKTVLCYIISNSKWCNSHTPRPGGLILTMIICLRHTHTQRPTHHNNSWEHTGWLTGRTLEGGGCSAARAASIRQGYLGPRVYTTTHDASQRQPTLNSSMIIIFIPNFESPSASFNYAVYINFRS